MNTADNDPFEEERRARLGALPTLIGFVQQALEDLRVVATIPPSQAGRDRFDRAMNLLFLVMSLGKPIAFREEGNGRRAFLWSDRGYNWIVCYRDGTFSSGRHESQAECEQEVGRLLTAPPGKHD